MRRLTVGDIVLSTKGRDKDNYFLVVKVDKQNAYLANGRDRKVTALKKKNIKHLESVRDAVLVEYALRINNGDCVSNEKLYKAIKAVITKKQED